MHWLIPSVSHTVLCSLAWLWNTVTPVAAVLSFALAASQSIHPWSAFYGLFALVFATGSCVTAILQYQSRESATREGKPAAWTRNAAYFACNLLIVGILVPVHQFYLKYRLTTAPWFHTRRSPYGCLPIPSRTLTQPYRYSFADAIGNSLPYGVVASYAIAMACICSTGLRDHSNAVGLKPSGVIAGVAGAAVAALLASDGLPMCGEDPVDGKHEVAMHVDRSVEWKERTPMAWSMQDRYIKLVILIAAVGSYGSVIAGQMASAARKRKLKALAAKAITSPQDVKEKKQNEDADKAAKLVIDEQTDFSSYQKASLVANLLVTIAVVLGMAFWSWSGPRAKQTQKLLDF